MGIITIAIAVGYSFPMEMDWQASLTMLESLRGDWWKVLGLSIIFFAIATLLAKRNFIVASEYAAATGALIIFYPNLVLIAALPSDMGFITLFFIIGYHALIISASTYAGLSFLQIIKKAP